MPGLPSRLFDRIAIVRDAVSCWTWTGFVDDKGYGRAWDGCRTRLAHRVIWAFTIAPIPPDACILHRCDNPLCVRPSHLFIGTQADNVSDMMRKGREGNAKLRGQRSPNAKLTDAQARTIWLHGPKPARGAVSRLAREYGVSRITIDRIISGKAYRQ